MRLKRHRMAAATSVLVLGILYAAHLQGALSTAAMMVGGAAIVAFVAIFYFLFQTGLNQRFADPSLTLAQMLSATIVLLGTMYAADAGRSMFLLLLLMVFMFGVLRFDTRGLLRYAAFLLFAYAAVIALSWVNKRESFDLGLALLQWVTLALALPWFAWMGGYIR